MSYKLSLLAEADLEQVYREGIRLFGPNQASLYLSGLEQALEFVTEHPRVNRARQTSEGPVRVQRFNSHVIIYQLDPSKKSDDVFILRIRHGREDWTE